jgi:peptide deformylase
MASQRDTGHGPMPFEPEKAQQTPAVAAFIAELRHWREVAGCSQKTLAGLVGYTPSYISKVEGGTVLASRSFAELADQHLHAGRALVRRWKDMHDALVELPGSSVRREESPAPDPRPILGYDLLVEHEHAELTHQDGMYETRIRRQLRNTGTQPVTRYLVRIAVDRYPGDPERSNRLYREDPLTWEEIGLSAAFGDEPMSWRVKEDRDASKEVWLLFENADGRFPLYPGETAWISYVYTVKVRKWGPWWQRAIRLPTRRLSMTLVFPARLRPFVWGMETSLTAEASPFRTSISRQEKDDQVVFTWSTDEPPLHARYRIEWKFRARDDEETADVDTISPAERMRSLDIAQEGDPVLAEIARPFDLPAEAEDARRVVAQLVSALERVGQVHNFTKGMGLAAPQVRIGRAAAVIRTPEGETITLLNPKVSDESAETDEQYEGCLSFFDVRGKVPRPLAIEVEHQDVDGTTRITAFERGLARLVYHEIDHLFGVMYKSRMRAGVEPIPVAKYKGTGQQWTYR